MAKNKNDLTPQEALLLRLIRTTPKGEDELATRLEVDKHTLYEIAHSLSEKGYRVRVDQEHGQLLLEREAGSRPAAIAIERVLNRYRIVFLAEARVGHKCEQLSLLHTVYELIAEHLKPSFIVLGGLTAGKDTPSHRGELFAQKHTSQTVRAARHFPRIPRIKTYIIGGMRDRSWLTGIGYDIVSAVCGRRNDLVNAGTQERDFLVGNVTVRVMAVGDDVTQRSGRSYQAQRRADEITGDKPDILVCCGWHSEAYLPDFVGMHVFSIGSLHDQTGKQRKKGIANVQNILVLDIELDPKTKKLRSLTPTWIPLEHLIQEADYLAGTEILEGCPLEGLPRQILKFLIERKAVSRGEIKRHFKLNTKTLDAEIDAVEEACRTLRIELAYRKDTKQFTMSLPYRRRFAPVPGAADDLLGVTKIKWAAVSDTHLNEKSQQPTILCGSYRTAEEEDVEFITHSGDFTGGPGATGYRGHAFDVLHHGLDDLEDYVARIYPVAKKTDPDGTVHTLKTYMIGGQHDNWVWKYVGHSIIRALDLRREDLIALSRSNAGFHEVGGLLLKLLHPDGGQGRSMTYKLEHHMERYSREQRDAREKILLSGHLHVAVYDRLRGIRGFIVPCMKGPDDYHEGRGLIAHLGMWILTARLNKDGRIVQFVTKYVSFQDEVKENDY